MIINTVAQARNYLANRTRHNELTPAQVIDEVEKAADRMLAIRRISPRKHRELQKDIKAARQVQGMQNG